MILHDPHPGSQPAHFRPQGLIVGPAHDEDVDDPAFAELALLHPGATVAAVSHAVNVRLALAAVTDRPRHLWRRDLPNGSVTAFDVAGDRIELVTAPATAGELAAHA